VVSAIISDGCKNVVSISPVAVIILVTSKDSSLSSLILRDEEDTVDTSFDVELISVSRHFDDDSVSIGVLILLEI
jgi:hypothetical protein